MTMSEFIDGLRCYLRAAGIVRKNRLWLLLLFPGLVGVLYFPATIYVSLKWGGLVSDYLRENWLPELLQGRVISWLIMVVLWVAGVYVGFVLFRNVVMVLYSPILGRLSYRTEQALRPERKVVEAEQGLLHGAVRAVGMSGISLMVSLLSLVLCLFLMVVPVVGQMLAAVLLPATQMYVAGQGFMDPVWERRGKGVRESLGIAWRNRMRCLGCGAGFLAITLVPLIGWFLGPTLGVVAGTLNALELEGRA